MISANDSTIIAMLSRFPDMSAEEADSYVQHIEHEENIPICKAILGKIDRSELGDDARQTFDEYMRWAENRTLRVRNEQWSVRQRQQENRLALQLNRLLERGVVSNTVLLMYGISGDLPERNVYQTMTTEEKQALWQERMEQRFGPHWQNILNIQGELPPLLNPLLRKKVWEMQQEEDNWLHEGF